MTDNPRLAARALAPTLPTPAQQRPAPNQEQKQDPLSIFQSDRGLSFGDLVDAVNPLQHLPVVSSVYREVSGDNIGLAARLAGGFIFGGPIGLLASAGMAAFESISGDTPLGHLASLADGDGKDPAAGSKAAAGTALADAGTGKPTVPWMAAEADGTKGGTALPSAAAFDAALRKMNPRPAQAATAGTAAAGTGVAGSAGAGAAGDTTRPAPQLLAKLYEMQATQPAGQRSVKL
ncbi:hypothetical protein [Azospirillum thermophilum]|uniref:Uncharacterized protein n=1 Tax=Azospirillum thermophilum TaxID=2202148 RepID=A0A2S2CUN8_9PROT|nr:hypothetical protein [Azospirillum thermophilum]AWK88233.1 hypothetical protein DEW08_19205 [Azospirillum thermophilum]